MSSSKVSPFDLRKQLAFYGAYHSNPINVAIHIIFVPLIVWSAFVLTSPIPIPHFIPKYTYTINNYLQFEVGIPALIAGMYLVYYYALEPVTALSYTPQMVFSLLTATAVSQNRENLKYAAVLHAVAWVAQFFGHGLAEKRAPALLDNLIGALALAPFFVHFEILFKFGYWPEMQKNLKNDIGKEILRIRTLEAEKKRAKTD